MALHPELNNLRHLCIRVDALDAAILILSAKMGSEKNVMRRTMIEVSIQELKSELEYTGRQIQRLLNNHYAKHQSILFNPLPQNDSSQS